MKPLAQVEVIDRESGARKAVNVGVGSIDAAFKAVAQALGYRFLGKEERPLSSPFDLRLVDFHIDAVGKGTESLGVCGIVIEDLSGMRSAGLGKDYDIVAAGIKALVNALNRLEAYRSRGEELKRLLAAKAEG